jgi:hypothetical protein
MGFFDKVKAAAIKAKCATGFHAGEYAAIEGKPECHFEKTCPDCNKYLTLFKHQFYAEPEYEKAGSCIKAVKCEFCDHIHRETDHVEYTVVGQDDYCRTKERCVRCSHEKVGDAKHSWVRLYDGENETVIYMCSRCDKKESRKKTKF